MHITQSKNLVDTVEVELFDIYLKIRHLLNEFKNKGHHLLGVHESLYKIGDTVGVLPLDNFEK